MLRGTRVACVIDGQGCGYFRQKSRLSRIGCPFSKQRAKRGDGRSPAGMHEKHDGRSNNALFWANISDIVRPLATMPFYPTPFLTIPHPAPVDSDLGAPVVKGPWLAWSQEIPALKPHLCNQRGCDPYPHLKTRHAGFRVRLTAIHLGWIATNSTCLNRQYRERGVVPSTD